MSKKLGYITTGLVATMVYEVLPSSRLCCQGCGKTMQSGEHFTRHGMPGGGNRLFPFCRTCEPFEEREALEELEKP